MKDLTTLKELNALVCLKDDWKDVLKVLEESKLSFWLTGKEKYQDYYLVKEPDSKDPICCFTFSQEGNVGILKNFGISNQYRGKGLGTYIANNILPKVAKERGIKNLYLQGNDRGPFTSLHFWKKTIYKQISANEIKDKFFKDYLEYLTKNYSDEIFCRDASFCLSLS